MGFQHLVQTAGAGGLIQSNTHMKWSAAAQNNTTTKKKRDRHGFEAVQSSPMLGGNARRILFYAFTCVFLLSFSRHHRAMLRHVLGLLNFSGQTDGGGVRQPLLSTIVSTIASTTVINHYINHYINHSSQPLYQPLQPIITIFHCNDHYNQPLHQPLQSTIQSAIAIYHYNQNCNQTLHQPLYQPLQSTIASTMATELLPNTFGYDALRVVLFISLQPWQYTRATAGVGYIFYPKHASRTELLNPLQLMSYVIDISRYYTFFFFFLFLRVAYLIMCIDRSSSSSLQRLTVA